MRSTVSFLLMLSACACAIPRILEGALDPNSSVLLVDTTKLQQTMHLGSAYRDSADANLFYAVGARDGQGRVLEMAVWDLGVGASRRKSVQTYTWDGGLPLIRPSAAGQINTPNSISFRSYQGDSLTFRDSSWSVWNPSTRTVLTKTYGDSICPYRDSIALDAQMRVVLWRSCRPGKSGTIDAEGVYSSKVVSSWTENLAWYREDADSLPWRELENYRSTDTALWQLQDSCRSVGKANTPDTVLSRAGTYAYVWDARGRMTTESVFSLGHALAWKISFEYDASGRLVKWINTDSGVSDTISYAYAMAATGIRNARKSELRLIPISHGFRVEGARVRDALLLDGQGRLLWQQQGSNLLQIPPQTAVSILRIRTSAGEWSVPLPIRK
jgi:YD repeat-containing protein